MIGFKSLSTAVAALSALTFAQNASMPMVVQQVGTSGYHWVDTWTTMPQLVEYANLPPNGTYNQTNLVFFNTTIRQTIHTSIGGSQIRLRFSNRFGNVDLPITAVTIAYVLRDT